MVRQPPSASAVRQAKAELADTLRGHPQLRGVGVARRGEDLVVRVNWETLPAPADRIAEVGGVEVEHREVGRIVAQTASPGVPKP